MSTFPATNLTDAAEAGEYPRYILINDEHAVAGDSKCKQSLHEFLADCVVYQDFYSINHDAYVDGEYIGRISPTVYEHASVFRLIKGAESVDIKEILSLDTGDYEGYEDLLEKLGLLAKAKAVEVDLLDLLAELVCSFGEHNFDDFPHLREGSDEEG